MHLTDLDYTLILIKFDIKRHKAERNDFMKIYEVKEQKISTQIDTLIVTFDLGEALYEFNDCIDYQIENKTQQSTLKIKNYNAQLIAYNLSDLSYDYNEEEGDQIDEIIYKSIYDDEYDKVEFIKNYEKIKERLLDYDFYYNVKVMEDNIIAQIGYEF